MKLDRIRKIIFFIFLSFTANYAQHISLEDAVEFALVHNQKIKQYEAKLEQKKYQNLEAFGNFLPKIDLVGSYTHLNDPLTIDLDPIRQAMIQMQSSNQVEFANIYNILQGNASLNDQERAGLYQQYSSNLNELLPAFQETLKKQDYKTATIVGIQPLFTGGKILAAKKYASLEEESAKVELKQIHDEVVKETTQKYLAVVLVKDVIKVREDVLQLVTMHRNRADKFLKQGLIANYNLLRAEVAVADAEKNLAEDKNKLDLAYLSLKSTMGLDLNENIEIYDSLTLIDSNVSLDTMISSAEKNNLVLKLLELKKSAVDEKYNVERSNFLPTIAAFGKYELYPEYLSALEPRWAAGISLNLNLFNGLKDYSKLQSASYLIDELDYLKADVERKINLLVKKNFVDVKNAKENFIKNLKTVELANENLRLNNKRFETGLGTSLEVVDASLSYEKTLIDSKTYIYEYYTSLSELYFNSGNAEMILTILSYEETKNEL